MLNFRGSVYFRNWISYSLPLLGGSILIVNPGSVLIINQHLFPGVNNRLRESSINHAFSKMNTREDDTHE